MRLIIACCVLMILNSCATVKTPSDYSKDRLSEDSINWEYQSRNDMMDMPDGGDTFKNRNINFTGFTY